MHKSFRLHLQDEYLKRTQRNGQYSLRAFALALGVGSSDLSKIMRGARRVTPGMIQRLAVPLGLSKAQVKYFVANESGEKPAATQFSDVGTDTFRVISDWYHFAILELMKLPTFEPSPHWLAKQLSISVIEARLAVERLERVGFLQRLPDRWIDCVGPTMALSSYRTTTARKKLQKQILAQAAAAIDNVEFHEREQSSVIMAISSSKMAQAKEIVSRFRKEMIDLLAAKDSEKDQLAILTISLFPVTQSAEGASYVATKRHLRDDTTSASTTRQ
jgi:uncharacterized protein (TIGR02147 family)